MNKLFTKIGVAMVGFAMAVGVGVAVGNKPSVEKVSADDPEATVSGNFVRYTGEISDGDYVFNCTYTWSRNTYNRTVKNEVSSNKLTSISQTISSSISNPVVSTVWHIAYVKSVTVEATTTKYYSIYNAAIEKYIVATGTKSQANLSDSISDEEDLFSIAYYTTDQTYNFVSKYNASRAPAVNANLRMGTDSANGYLACYANSTQGYLKLFKKDSLSSIAMDGNQTASFNVGDSFTIGSGKVVPTYSVSGTSTATNSGLTYQFKASGAADFGAMPETFNLSHNGGTVKVTYTDAYSQIASATYSITVSYATITGLSLDVNSLSVARTENHQFVATPVPSNANPSVSWNATSATLAKGSDKDFEITENGLLKVHSSIDGTITVTATSTVDGTKTASCTVTVNGTPTVSLNNGTITGVYSGQTGTNALTATALNFSGDVTYSWESEDDSKVSISGSGATVTLNYLAACTELEITVTASYSTEEDSAVCLVTVAESAVTTFSISPTSLNLFAGKTGTITATVEACGIYNTNVTWTSDDTGVATVDGGVVTAVAYGTTTITATASDGQTKTCEVTVVDHLNTINASTTSTGLTQGFDPATNKTSNTSLTIGDITISTTNGDFNNGTDYRIYKSATLTISSTVATITQIDFTFESSSYDGGGWSSRYTPNSNTWSATAKGGSSGEQARLTSIVVTYNKTVIANIADTNFTAQKALMDYVRTFNSTLACVMDGSTTGINGASGKWKQVSDAFDTALSGLAGDNLATFKALVKNATATTRDPVSGEANTGDALQNMLAKYDYIIAKYNAAPYSYSLNDFLHSAAGRTAVSGAKVVTPFGGETSDSNFTVLVVISSAIALVSIAGYFVIRRKKEN